MNTRTLQGTTAGLCLLLMLPALATAGGYALPPYEKIVLDNGLAIVLMEQHEVPLIDVNVVIGGGAMGDGEHSGLAGLTAESLLFGAGTRDKATLDRQFDFIGAVVRAGAEREFSRLQASFATRDLDIMLPILVDLLREPTFAADEFAKYQLRQVAQLARQKESPRAVIDNYFHKLLLGGHPYAVVPEGNAEAVQEVTRDDLDAYHRQWYQPQNITLCVVGDFAPRDLEPRLRAAFGDWARGESRLPAVPPVPSPDRPRVLLVDKADAGESTFTIGGAGVAATNPDRVGLQVINTIIGGRFTSWLNDELRVNAGLTYGAHSSFVSYGQGGLFRISTFTRTPTTFDAIDLALATYARLWEKGIDAETLASAKAYVKGQFPPRYETSGQLAGLLARMQFYGYDESYINTFEAKVNDLTVAETQRLIATYFPRENLQFVVVGKADEIRERLKQYGELSEVEIQQNGFAF
jgi:predicted Zn-dependent peptidase